MRDFVILQINKKSAYNKSMLIQLVINAIAFYVTAYLIQGMTIANWQTLLVVSIVWGILTVLIRPILIILTLPITILTLGLFTFVINALLLMLMGTFVPGFAVAGFGTALLAAVVLALLNMFLSQIFQ
jgi:putative membrane protein